MPRLPRTRPGRAYALPAALHLRSADPPDHPRRDHQDRVLQRFSRLDHLRRPDHQERRPGRAGEAAQIRQPGPNGIMLSNVADLTEVLSAMATDGHPVTAALAASTSPYMRKNIRRFGKYDLDMDDLPDPLDPTPLPFDLPL